MNSIRNILPACLILASTPNIEFLASHGLQFTNAFSNAPVCSVARSTLISSCYAPRIGAQYHRRQQRVPVPGDLRMFPAYLRDAEYLALFGDTDPAPVINEALASSSDMAESWLILNTVALLKDMKSPFSFSIDENKFSKEFLEDGNIIPRLKYINETATE
jgi:hypothetical protein